jgi:hypothetical protein
MAKQRKDFLRIKYKNYPLNKPEQRARRRRHHSLWNAPRGLRQPRREWSQYAAFVPDFYVTGESGWRCDTRGCQNHGYGPMLRSIVWNRHFAGVSFACEPCMVRRLGRPLGPRDLRNCLMNLVHPAYDPDLRLSL